MTLDVYLLIGNNHTRKSSLLRALTGCFNRNVRDIELVNGKSIRLYARCTALQESRTEAADFVLEAGRHRCQAVALCLLPEANPLDPQRWPDANRYIQSFQQAGWTVRKTAVLGAHPVKPAAGAVVHLPSVLHQPINSTAATLRSHFGWR